jgi:hypothetical protein
LSKRRSRISRPGIPPLFEGRWEYRPARTWDFLLIHTPTKIQ